jgi:hypothetical protein
MQQYRTDVLVSEITQTKSISILVTYHFRLILADKAAVPLDNVLPVIFEHLPLNEDQVRSFVLSAEVFYVDEGT